MIAVSSLNVLSVKGFPVAAAPTKLDLRKSLKHLYNPPSSDFTLIDVPPMHFLMVDGHGDPGGDLYAQAVEALYSVSYPLKFMSKRELGVDYSVMPLEGLWWAEDYHVFSAETLDRDAWQWTSLIMQPDHLTREMVDAAIAEAGRKKDLPALANMRFDTFHEGLSVQIMHIGPFSAEGPTLKRLHEEYIPQHGFDFVGKHHEIYLSDPRRADPAKMKTVLRQPVKPLPDR